MVLATLFMTAIVGSLGAFVAILAAATQR